MLKKIVNHKVFYVVLSIVIAVMFWVYVDIQTDESYTTTFANIPVTFEDEESLNERGLSINHDEASEVITLKLSGKRSDMMKLSRSNITITVRTSQITSAGTSELEYTIGYPKTVNESAITVVRRSADKVTVTVAAESTKTIPVQAKFTGNIADGYNGSEVECSPETITIVGPQDVLEQVSCALVVIPNNDVSETIAADFSYKLVDEDGNEIAKDDISCDTTLISVSMVVGYMKEVPLTVTLEEGGGATEQDAKVTIEPEKITISGDKATVDSINSIDLGSVSLAQVLSTSTFTRDVTVPDSVVNLSGTTEADVTVTISGLSSRSFSATNFVILNAPQGYAADCVTESLDVVLRGTDAALNAITEEDITVAIDLSSLDISTGKYGTITVPATVTVNVPDSTAGLIGSETVGAVGDYNAVVNIH